MNSYYSKPLTHLSGWQINPIAAPESVKAIGSIIKLTDDVFEAVSYKTDKYRKFNDPLSAQQWLEREANLRP